MTCARHASMRSITRRRIQPRVVPEPQEHSREYTQISANLFRFHLLAVPDIFMTLIYTFLDTLAMGQYPATQERGFRTFWDFHVLMEKHLTPNYAPCAEIMEGNLTLMNSRSVALSMALIENLRHHIALGRMVLLSAKTDRCRKPPALY